jgi:hypothetical protein
MYKWVRNRLGLERVAQSTHLCRVKAATPRALSTNGQSYQSKPNLLNHFGLASSLCRTLALFRTRYLVIGDLRLAKNDEKHNTFS